MARTTVSNTIGRIRRQLHSVGRNETNVVNEALDTSETDVTLLSDTNAVRVGTVLNVDLELMKVTAYNSGTKVATVIRGWMDSDPASHSDQAECVVNPRWSNLDIHDAMVDEINSWGPQLYRILSDEFVVESGTQTIQLPASWATMYGLVTAVRKWDDQFQETTAWPELNLRLIRGTTDWTEGASTSGLLVRLIDPVASGTVYLIAALPFSTTAPALTDDLITTLFIPESMHDMLVMGVKLRLWGDYEIGRSSRQAQDDSRRAEENPPGGTMQPMQLLMAQYRNRKQEEINKLRAKFPVRWS